MTSGTPFLMPIDDVFSIKGRRIVVTGRVERGEVRRGDIVEIVDPQSEALPIRATVAGLEAFGTISVFVAGDNAALLLKDVDPDAVRPGMILVESDASNTE